MPYDPIQARERACKMPGRSRLECFGCPLVSCAFNEQPFSSIDTTTDVVLSALELLKTNRVWLLGPEAVAGRTLYESLGDNPEAELFARLIEHRQDFLRNLAVEGVSAGVLSTTRAAELARMQSMSTTNENGFYALLDAVNRREELLAYVVEEGRQRHTAAMAGAE